MREGLDYKGLYEMAKAQAEEEAKHYYPPSEKKKIEREARRLTDKYYFQMITPPNA